MGVFPYKWHVYRTVWLFCSVHATFGSVWKVAARGHTAPRARHRLNRVACTAARARPGDLPRSSPAAAHGRFLLVQIVQTPQNVCEFSTDNLSAVVWVNDRQARTASFHRSERGHCVCNNPKSNVDRFLIIVITKSYIRYCMVQGFPWAADSRSPGQEMDCLWTLSWAIL